MGYSSLIVFIPTIRFPIRVFYRDVLDELEKGNEVYILSIKHLNTIDKLEIIAKNIPSKLEEMINKVKNLTHLSLETVLTFEILTSTKKGKVVGFNFFTEKDVVVEETSKTISDLNLKVPIYTMVFYKVESFHGIYVNVPTQFIAAIKDILGVLESFKIRVDKVDSSF